MKRELLITYVVFTLNNIAFFVQQFNLPFLAKRYGLSDATFGISQTFFGALQIAGGPVFGILTNKFGLKVSIHICNLMTIFTYLILLTFDSYFGFFLSRLPGFLMQGMQAHKALLAEMTTPGEERTNAFGKIGLCFGICFVIAPLINGFSAVYSESAFLYIGIVLCIIAVLITQISIPEKEVHQEDAGFSWANAIQLVKQERVLSIFLQKNISMISAFSGFIVLQLFLIDKFSLTAKHGSFIQMGIGISTMVISGMLLPTLRKKFQEPQLIVFGIYAFIIATLQFCYFIHLAQLVLVIPAFSFGMGMMNSVCDSLLTSSVEAKDQSLILGLSNSSLTLIMTISPAIGGFILQNYGFETLGILGVLGSASALVTGYLLPIVEKPKTS